jgi:hypothetical protein
MRGGARAVDTYAAFGFSIAAIGFAIVAVVRPS